MSKHCLFSLLILVLATASAYCQTGTGQIQGTVTDATGAVLPNAKITLRQASTGADFTTTTTSVGFFTFPTLRAGEYHIAVLAPGMKKWEGQVVLQVGQTAVVDPS